MPEPISHVVATKAVAAGTASGLLVLLSDIEPIAYLGAFAGALLWAGVMTEKTITLRVFIEALIWFISGVFCGTFGGIALVEYAFIKYPILEGFTRLPLVAMACFLAAFLTHILLNAIVKYAVKKVNTNV